MPLKLKKDALTFTTFHKEGLPMPVKALKWEYDAHEDDLVRRFHEHPFWLGFQNLSNDQILSFLLQTGHLSTDFVRWYEVAKLGMESDEAKEVVRRILRDEIPQQGPTHQDNRLADLWRMGVSKEKAVCTEATPKTRQTLREMHGLVRFPQEDYDLRVLIALRVFGEILVAETYRRVVGCMEKQFGLTVEESVFYAPHFFHDKKDGEDGHTQAFDELLSQLICDERTVAVASETATRAFKVRFDFHDQFIAM